MGALHRTPVRLGLLGLGSLVVVGSVLWSQRAESGRAAGAPPSPRGIVLVCVDTLRADGMSLPDERDGPMPRLQAFACDATVFAHATASSAWTAPSITSLLTGLRPSQHGVEAFGRASPLALSVPTLAEALHAGGWSTGAITGGGWVSPEQGLARGFDTFATTFDELGPEAALFAWDRARPKDRPFFLFLHTYAAHDPYGQRAWMRGGTSRLHAAATLAPAALAAGLERGGGRLPEDLLTPFVLQHLTNPLGRLACAQAIGAPRYDDLWRDAMPWIDGGYAASGDASVVQAAVRASYRAGLGSADEVVHEAFTSLARLGLLDRADVIVTSDHGESFGEHRTLAHGLHLYDDVLRVPLLIRARGRMPAPRRVREACGGTDVAPTILDLAGLVVPPGLDGRSLVGLAGRASEGRTVVAELERGAHPKHPMEGRVRLVAVRSAAWKWILRFDPADGRVLGEELYDLAQDPQERAALPMQDGLPPGVGDEFCRAVAAERNRVRRLAGLEAVQAACLPN